MLHPLITVIGFVLATILEMPVLWVMPTICGTSLQAPEASSATTPRYSGSHSYDYTPSASYKASFLEPFPSPVFG